MKPNVPVARRSDYTFCAIPHSDGRVFIERWHYARGCSKTGKMFGMFRGSTLVGVAQSLPPTRVCAESVLAGLWRQVSSLTRLAVADTEPQNAESILIGAWLRWMRSLKDARGRQKWLAVVTFADESQGHAGTIYKATNWILRGYGSANARWVDEHGRQVATKRGPITRTAQQMRDAGYTMTGKFRKLKFVQFLT